MITIVHGGQTGVDRGAHRAALDNGWAITGFMPSHGRDEDGLITRAVASYLTVCPKFGYPARTRANLAISQALLVVVPDAEDPMQTQGTKLTLLSARDMGLPRRIVDPRGSANIIAQWIQMLVNRHVSQTQLPFRLMIAGPRASKWPEGYAETAGFLRRVKREIDVKALKDGLGDYK